MNFKVFRLKINRNRLLLFLFFLFYLFFVFQKISKPQMVLWDEAGFIGVGYQFHKFLAAKDFFGFIKLTKNEVYYPFFQGWFLAIFSLPFEYSINLARFLSLLLIIPSVSLIFLLSKQIENRNFTPFIAAGVFLTSPMVVYYYSSAMKEGLGATLTLFSLFLYFKAKERNSNAIFFLTGFILTCLTLTKYTYGFLVFMAILLDFAIERFRFLKVKNLISFFFAPFLILGFWMFLIPGNFAVIVNYLKNIPDYVVSPLRHLFYYPLEVIFVYHLSWPIAVLTLLGFFFSFKDFKNYQVRILILLFLINFLLAEKNFFKNQGRYLFTTMPAFYILGSCGFSRLLINIRQKLNGLALMAGFFIPFIAAGVFLIIKDLFFLPSIVRATASHETGGAVFYQRDYQGLDRFSFNRAFWPKGLPFESEKIEDIFEFIFLNVDLSKNIFLVGQANEFSPYLFKFYILKGREKGLGLKNDNFKEYVILFEVLDGGRLDTLDFRLINASARNQIAKIINDSSYKVIAWKLFPYLGVKISVMGR
mgnify:CR=1 FL=1